ncbi:sulfate transporter CysZ [Wohlfahrtiimonas populi]|uniref:sulfate transporter CysZ n=1 Tax=Wohlfahrtiimonas populi TaxID=1940240 RepID=UPI00098CF2E6|nr:sulfate transporter CysZ [Wohlfahrtiimonas populi]
MNNPNSSTPQNGFYYFSQGWKLMLEPGLKRYIFMPILINILIIGSAFFYIYTQVSDIVNWALSYLPTWLHWLSYVLWPFILISVLIFFGYFFTTLANIIAAPFNGMLSAKLESMLTNTTAEDDSWANFAKDFARSIQREFQNLAYYIPRLIGILLLFLVPVIGTIVAPILLFLFNAWMMSIQYNDYAFDNNRVSFPIMRQRLKQDRTNNLMFGTMINLFTMIPFVNLVIMPAAVCGGTLQWVKKYRSDFVK